MPRNRLSAIVIAITCILLLCACAALKGGYVFPPQHPPEAELGDRRPLCTDCHEPRGENVAYERFNHTLYFAENHRQEAYQAEDLCSMCHARGFCNDCHATRVELKPSLKNQTDTFRRYPHRGDYLTRHRIDGRIDPTSCFRCHGNPKAAATCAPCHG